MSAIITFATKEGRRLWESHDPRSGPDPYEDYTTPLGEAEIICAADEREDYERDADTTLGADVLTREQFEYLFRWMRDNAGLDGGTA